MKTYLISLACLLLGTLAGWLSQDKPDVPPAAPPSTRISSRMANERQRANSFAVPPEVAARLSLLDAARTPDERLFAVIHLAQTLPVSDFASWYDAKWLSHSAKGTLAVFQKILRERWLEENPAELLEIAVRRDWKLAPDLAGQWARLDPDAALAFLGGLPGDEKHAGIRCKVAISLARERPEEALAIIAAHGTPGTDFAKWDDAILELARHHPQLLESAKLPDGLTDRVPVMLAASRLEQDFSSGLQALLDSPDGLGCFSKVIQQGQDESSGYVHSALSENLLKHLDRLPPEWIQKLATLDDFRPSNPEAWLAVDFGALGLSEAAAGLFQDKLWRAMAGINPEGVLDALAKSPSGPTRPSSEALIDALYRLDGNSSEAFQKHLDLVLGTATDPQFLFRLKFLQEQVDARRNQATEQRPSPASLLEMVTSGARFSEEEINQMKQQIGSLSIETPAELREIQGKLSAMDPSQLAKLGEYWDDFDGKLPLQDRARIAEAMIASQPSDHTRVATDIATSMLGEDSLAAGRWVAGLPAGEARTWASRNLAYRWLKVDAPAANRWIDSLPANERAELRKFVESN